MKVTIRSKQRQPMAHAQLTEDCVDRSYLYPRAPANVPERCGINVISAIRDQAGEG